MMKTNYRSRFLLPQHYNNNHSTNILGYDILKNTRITNIFTVDIIKFKIIQQLRESLAFRKTLILLESVFLLIFFIWWKSFTTSYFIYDHDDNWSNFVEFRNIFRSFHNFWQKAFWKNWKNKRQIRENTENNLKKKL